MHKPEPLGRYPLSLRNRNITNYKKGELLLDYTTYDLYYVDRVTGEMNSVAEIIYKQLTTLKLRNTGFIISEADRQDPPIDPKTIWPPISDRLQNRFYYVVHARSGHTQNEHTAYLI